MGHSEYIRIVEGSPVAVLMVHGIVGSPCHFDDLVPLVPENWTLCNIVLDGHGGSARDFGNTSMEKWKRQVSSWVDRLLACHEKLLIVAHSMGTLLAIREAVRNPERIAGLFLLAVPLRPWVTLRAWAASIKLGLGLDYSRDATAMAMRADSSVALQPGLLRYLCWVPRFVELLREIRLTRKLLPQLTVPTLALQSERDELVSRQACRDLAANDCITVIPMPNSGHFGYEGEDRERILAKFWDAIEKISVK